MSYRLPLVGYSGDPSANVIHLPRQETQDTWVWSLGQEDTLEKEMETHSNILPREISWTEETGGLQSIGSQRVQTWLSIHTLTHTHKVNIPTGIVSWVPARNMPLTRVIAQCITLWSIQFLVQVQIRGNFCFSNIACRRNLTLIRLMWEQAWKLTEGQIFL